MPPHCDTMDGPVVIAARKALDLNDVDIALPYVSAAGDAEVRAAFARVQAARKAAPAAAEVADLHFFETVVRVHRAGEGAPFTGIKPAGLGEGPVIPLAENAIETGSPDALIETLTTMLREQVGKRFAHMMSLQEHDPHDVPKARDYVEAMLGMEVYSHKLYLAMIAEATAHHSGHQHG